MKLLLLSLLGAAVLAPAAGTAGLQSELEGLYQRLMEVKRAEQNEQLAKRILSLLQPNERVQQGQRSDAAEEVMKRSETAEEVKREDTEEEVKRTEPVEEVKRTEPVEEVKKAEAEEEVKRGDGYGGLLQRAQDMQEMLLRRAQQIKELVNQLKKEEPLEKREEPQEKREEKRDETDEVVARENDGHEAAADELLREAERRKVAIVQEVKKEKVDDGKRDGEMENLRKILEMVARMKQEEITK